MHRVTAALPRLAACAVCVSAVLAQRRVRRGVDAAQQSELGSFAHERQTKSAVGTRASATLAMPSAATTPARVTTLLGGSVSTAYVVRNVFQALRNMWLSLAIGAAASWTAVSASMVSTLKQLQAGSAQHQVTAVRELDISSIKSFCGHWVKMRDCSESMDSFCELFGVPKWLRRATRLMSGLEIILSEEEQLLIIKQVCKLGWLSAVETFPVDGTSSKPHKRRDMRPGKQTGQLLAAHDGSVTVRVCWQGALPGSAVDTLQVLPSADGPVLVVQHKAQVDGRGTAEFKEQFRFST